MRSHVNKAHQTPAGFGRLQSLLRDPLRGVQWALIAVALLAWFWIAIQYVRSAATREIPTVPSSMEVVDWHSPDSSVYCLACHRTLGHAMASLDVEQGHSLNVAMTDEQLAAVAGMGTIAGPGNTVICTTCHVLDPDPQTGYPYMLAADLSESQLCLQCHPDQFAMNGTPHDLRSTAPNEKNRLDQTVSEGGPCSACHLAHHYARDFEPCALDPDGRCITCHSTYQCAQDLARMSMDHPESRCVECHNPHEETHTHYLKAEINALCTSCHDGFANGLAGGMHPTGLVDRPVPQLFIDAGAVVPDAGHTLNCVVCHETHTAIDRPLLRVAVESNDICRLCHDAVGASPHNERPVLSEAQLGVIDVWNTATGADGELLCVSCHAAHHTRPETPLLAFLPGDDACAACHPRQASVIGTAHDLRTNNPDEENLAGVTVREGGSCSACHLGHGTARAPFPSAGDAAGVCTTCHAPDACAENLLVGSVVHANTECTDCHDPHERRHENFLVKPDPQLCFDCHQEHQSIVGGPHDMRTNPAGWPVEAGEAGGLCLPCHFAHGGERPDLYRFGSMQHDSYHDDACLTCHADAGWDAESSVSIVHPHQISADQQKVPLALVPSDDRGNMRMGCRTCHDPHGGPEPVHLARVEPDEPTENLCLSCHDHGHILLSGHSSARLTGLGYDVDSCKPCHAMHAPRDASWGQMLSPRFLMKDCERVVEENAGCVPCLACHRSDGPAPLREIFTHPKASLTSVIDENRAGYLPLFNSAGHVDQQGQVTCRTCHLAHGWVPPGEDPEAVIDSLTPEQQRARRFALRPFVAPNVCTTCHGEEARWRFLFFHDPQRRTGP